MSSPQLTTTGIQVNYWEEECWCWGPIFKNLKSPLGLPRTRLVKKSCTMIVTTPIYLDQRTRWNSSSRWEKVENCKIDVQENARIHQLQPDQALQCQGCPVWQHPAQSRREGGVPRRPGPAPRRSGAGLPVRATPVTSGKAEPSTPAVEHRGTLTRGKSVLSLHLRAALFGGRGAGSGELHPCWAGAAAGPFSLRCFP